MQLKEFLLYLKIEAHTSPTISWTSSLARNTPPLRSRLPNLWPWLSVYPLPCSLMLPVLPFVFIIGVSLTLHPLFHSTLFIWLHQPPFLDGTSRPPHVVRLTSTPQDPFPWLSQSQQPTAEPSYPIHFVSSFWKNSHEHADSTWGKSSKLPRLGGRGMGRGI